VVIPALNAAETLPAQLAALDRQIGLRAVLVTHRHYDHVKDLATLGFNLFVRRRQLAVYCADEVRETLEATLLNPRIWIDFFAEPAPVVKMYPARWRRHMGKVMFEKFWLWKWF
jgi:glyoxylase-like metal-dependent hydrolase (beta-lactamase superfamily II)